MDASKASVEVSKCCSRKVSSSLSGLSSALLLVSNWLWEKIKDIYHNPKTAAMKAGVCLALLYGVRMALLTMSVHPLLIVVASLSLYLYLSALFCKSALGIARHLRTTKVCLVVVALTLWVIVSLLLRVWPATEVTAFAILMALGYGLVCNQQYRCEHEGDQSLTSCFDICSLEMPCCVCKVSHLFSYFSSSVG
jgi:hypothetical protein